MIFIFYAQKNHLYLQTFVHYLRNISKLNAVLVIYHDFKLKVYGFNPHTKFDDIKLIPIDYEKKHDEILDGKRLDNFGKGEIIFRFARPQFPHFHYEEYYYDSKLYFINIRGIDLNLFHIFANKYNGTLMMKHISLNFDDIGETDILIQKINPITFDGSIIKYFYGFEELEIVIYMPIPLKNSVADFMFHVFDIEILICTTSSMILLSTLWHWSEMRMELSSSNSGYLIIIFFKILIGQSISIGRSNFLKNLIVILIIFLAMLMNNFYQSEIASSMTLTSSERRFQSIEEVAKTKVKFLSIAENIKEALNGTEYDFGERIVNETNQLDKVNFEELWKKNIGILSTDLNMKLFMIESELKKGFDRRLNKFFYKVPGSILNIQRYFMLIRNSKYCEMFDEFMPRIFESGIYQHLTERFIGKLYHEETNENEAKYLGISDLGKMFVILPIGYSLAFIVLLIEKFYYRKYLLPMKKKRERKEKSVKSKSNLPIISLKTSLLVGHIDIEISNEDEKNEKLQLKLLETIRVVGIYDLDGKLTHELDNELFYSIEENSEIIGFILLDEEN